MAVKLFLDSTFLLEGYRFEGFSHQYKNDWMMNNCSNTYN